MALEAAGKADRAQVGGQQQGHGAGDGQGDTGGGLRCQADGVEEMIMGQAKYILALLLLILDGLQQSYSGLTTDATPDFIKNGLQIYLPWRPQ